MSLRHFTPIVILIIQLHEFSSAADLHKLANNKLDEGKDRELPNATPIHCGQSSHRNAKVTTAKNPGSVLTSTIFARDAFTSGPLGANNGPSPGAGKKWKFAEFHGDKVLYALNIDDSGELAYWLPQGSTIDIPQAPTGSHPKYVFTPDFSGCSWTATPMANGYFRLRHVEGGREHEQFNVLTEQAKGGPTTYALQYKDYGYIVETKSLTSNVPAYAFMHFTDGKWHLNVQRKSCTPETGGYTFNDHQVLTGMVMNEAKQTKYPPISGTKTYTVPH